MTSWDANATLPNNGIRTLLLLFEGLCLKLAVYLLPRSFRKLWENHSTRDLVMWSYKRLAHGEQAMRQNDFVYFVRAVSRNLLREDPVYLPAGGGAPQTTLQTGRRKPHSCKVYKLVRCTSAILYGILLLGRVRWDPIMTLLHWCM